MKSFADLSARARRGELSGPEQERLRIYLKSSLEARLWHEAGSQSDEQDRVLPGDHAAAERVLKRTLARIPGERAQRRRPPIWGLVAAVLLIASVAAASVAAVAYVRAQRSLGSQTVGKPSPSPLTPVGPARKDAAPSAPASVGVVSAESLPLALGERAAATPLPNATNSARAEPGFGASALLSAAALARREGNSAKAIALLDSLQDQYPASREARSSDLTLGTLHLKRGAAAIALRHFESYARTSPRGALAPEAWWGQYQALAALGRESEARERLRTLVARFPSSTYAGVAKAKLKVESTAP